jgi:hypothetical protein
MQLWQLRFGKCSNPTKKQSNYVKRIKAFYDFLANFSTKLTVSSVIVTIKKTSASGSAPEAYRRVLAPASLQR